MKKIAIFITILFLFIISPIKINASSNLNTFIINKDFDPSLEKNITAEILGIKDQNILPSDNFLYKIKNIIEKIKEIFIFKTESKIENYIENSSEKLLELEACKKYNSKDTESIYKECISESIKNYEEQKINLYKKLENIKQEEKISNIGKIFEHEIMHFNKLETIIEVNTALYPKIQEVKNKNIEKYSNFLLTVDNNADIKTKILEKQEKMEGSELKYINFNIFLTKLTNFIEKDLNKKGAIEQIISENNKILIAKLENITEDKEKIIKYYFLKIGNTEPVEQIEVINKLIVNIINTESETKEILNETKEISVKNLENNLKSLDSKSISDELNKILKGDSVKQLLTIGSIKEYTKNGEILFNIKNIEQYNIDKFIEKLSFLNNIEIENILSYIEKINPENIAGIMNNIKIDQETLDKTSSLIDDLVNFFEGIQENANILKEDMCDFKYEPVCGEDGVTYTNSCFAEKRNVQILHQGKCNIKINENLQEIKEEEIENGYYYGDIAEKKPNTPTTWINIDSGTKNAMWVSPEYYTGLSGIKDN
ncbi:Kazal-type serine protease inhibitor family protein [Patescibacteria group bacterium]|nr:Kazal-type serine protease inhibitor family protein [Patescibacteria group bacterium]